MKSSPITWEVYKLQLEDISDHPKFVVVVGSYGSAYYVFFINTLSIGIDELSTCEVRIDHRDHDFLAHESYINISGVRNKGSLYTLTEQQLLDGAYKGEISDKYWDEVIEGVRNCPTLRPNTRDFALKCLLNT